MLLSLTAATLSNCCEPNKDLLYLNCFHPQNDLITIVHGWGTVWANATTASSTASLSPFLF